MNTLYRLENGLSAILQVVVTLCFAVILALTLIQVTLRYGFNSSVKGGHEIMEYLFIYTTAIGAAVAVSKGAHIRISVLIDNLGGWAKRGVEILNLLLVALANVVLVWVSLQWIADTQIFASPVLHIPEVYLKSAIPAGSGLAILFCFTRIAALVAQPQTAAPEGDR